MPELPEVETIKRGLNQELIGQTIRSVEVRAAKLFIGDPKDIDGQKVLEIERRAKLLIWKLEKNYLLMHLKMTGQLIYIPNKQNYYVVGGHPDRVYTLELPHKHSHLIFEFDNGRLYFNDLRKFGWVKVVTDPELIKAAVAEYGPEYDWPEFTLDYFTTELQKHTNWTIKQALLNQTIVAGLGNIYADESLFCARILPKRKIAELAPAELNSILTCIPKVLNLALQHGDTSADQYRKTDGSLGTYLAVANVYKREGLPCKACSTPIARMKIAGRSSHYCPACQK